MISAYRLFVVCAAGLALFGAVAMRDPAFGADPAREAIDKANGVWLAGFAAGEPEKMASVYATDAEVLPPGSGSINGRAAIGQFWQGFLKNGFKNLALRTAEAESQGDLAYEVGEFSFDVPQKDGTSAKAAGKYVVVWKRVDGAWQIYRDIWNDAPLK